MLRLPTVNQYNSTINSISRQFEQISQLQLEVASGKKIQSASENPLLAERIQDSTAVIQYIKSFQLNGTLASSRNDLVSSTIEESINIINRVQDLIQSAQNDTLNNQDRSNIAVEIAAQLSSMNLIANTQDSNGNYIFSGMSVNKPPFVASNGGLGTTYQYQGSQDKMLIPIGNNTNVLFNDSGLEVFSAPNTDNIFNVMQNIINVLNQPIESAQDTEYLHQTLSSQEDTWQQLQNHFQNYLANTGSRGRMIDDYLAMSNNNLFNAQILSGKLADADLAEVVSDLTQRLTALELTQKSYLQIQETYLSLLKK